MESISKTPVSAATARSIVADAFGNDVGVSECTELTEGWFNAAYSLTLDDGRRVVLKVAPPPDVEVLTYERDIIRAEVEALRLIGSRTDAPVPEVLWFDRSARRVPSPLFLMQHVPGASLGVIGSELATDERAEVDALLGRHLRSINEISGPAFGLLAAESERYPTWAGAFGALVESVLVDGERRSIELPVPYDDIRAVMTAGTAALDEITEPRLVYWDLWDGNVMVDTTTHELTGMLDLERALWGDPLMESQFSPHVDSPALLAAYGPIDTTSAGALRRRALYTMHLHLVMCIEGIYRQYPEDPVGDWARTQLADDVAALPMTEHGGRDRARSLEARAGIHSNNRSRTSPAACVSRWPAPGSMTSSPWPTIICTTLLVSGGRISSSVPCSSSSGVSPSWSACSQPADWVASVTTPRQ